MLDYDVVICGLGPVGQLLALLLADLGASVLAVEARTEPYPLPRAAVIDDEVLRIFQSVGLDGAVLAGAQVQPRASIVTSRGRVVDVLDASVGRLGHPPLVSINQPALERTMLAALRERATVDLRWGTALEQIDQAADGVDLSLRAPDTGHTSRVRAGWLVGCDGGHSHVRTQLGIDFAGRTAPQRWIVVDALVDRPLAKAPHPLFVGDRRRPAVTLPMSPGRHRWEWMLHDGEDAAPLIAPDAIAGAVGEWLDGERVEIERAVVYAFHTRMAERWRQGRILLAGDAAHLMPPFAGQGFSSGARDAANLAWKLRAVLDGASDGLLDSYELERRPHVAAMQRLANLMGGLVQSTHPVVVGVRDAALTAFEGTRIHRWTTTNVKPLPSYRAGAFARRPARLAPRRTTGTLFPQTGRSDDALPAGWSAVSIDVAASSALRRAGLPVADAHPESAWLRDRGLAFAILRPDRFVYACGAAHGVDGAIAAWRTLTARPATCAP